MHIEKRKEGKKEKYYLSHSYREGKKVHKIRKFLGKDIDDIITILQSIGIEKVALLPYHDLAKHKAERFSLRENSESFSCSAEFLKASITKFEKAGFTVQSGG